MRHAFLGVLNGRSLLALLGLTAVVALTRWLAAWGQGVSVRLPTLSGLAVTLLLPGLLMLLAAAATEAWLARRPGRPSDWWWRIGMVMGACALVLAWRVLSWPDPRAPVYWGYFISRTLLFGSLGAAAYGLLVLSQRDARARADLLQAKVQRDRLRAQQLQAQLSVLNAQIEPHFLFNTLATVKRLIEIQPERGRVMLSRLIAYLRASLPSLRGQDSDLRTELEAVRNYLTLLQMRMGERLRFQIEAETELLSLRLPPLLLVTLVENGGDAWPEPLARRRTGVGARPCRAGRIRAAGGGR